MFAVDAFKYKIVKDDEDYAKVSIGPLPKGYGVTLGNALRRILLSSIQGAAITSVQISGVKHEYTTLAGVADDMLRILLNIKQIAIRSHSTEAQELELKMKGKKIVTAKDIKVTSDIEIINPDLIITELTDAKGKIDMKLIAETGAGYIPSDEGKRGQVGIIPLDANFSPITRVVFNITKARVGQQTDLDQVDLEVFTNKVISGVDAIRQAVEIYHKVISRLLKVVDGEEAVEVVDEVEEKKVEEASSSDLDIDKLNLSTRLTNSLLKSGYKNLTEIEGMTVDEIMEIRGLGQRTAEELIDIMRSYKLNIKE